MMERMVGGGGGGGRGGMDVKLMLWLLTNRPFFTEKTLSRDKR